MEKRRFPFYGVLLWIDPVVYLSSDDMEYSGTECCIDGTEWDIVMSYDGNYYYTRL